MFDSEETKVTFLGEPVELNGTLPVIGRIFENVALTDSQSGEKVQLEDYVTGVTFISVIPNVTTETCTLQTQKFAEQLMDTDHHFITISRNTPEEFEEWKKEKGLEDIVTLVDSEGEFGTTYGVEMDGKDMLTRAVFVTDKTGAIQYMEVVEEASNEPDYETAIEKADELEEK